MFFFIVLDSFEIPHTFLLLWTITFKTNVKFYVLVGAPGDKYFTNIMI